MNYKQKQNDFKLKSKSGVKIWFPLIQGTYNRSIHGAIGSESKTTNK